MKQQDLVWVRLPFSNLQESKVRPAVVVSNNDYNKNSPDILVCAITSNLEPRRYSVLIGQESLLSGNLPVKSRIRADKIMQIEKSLIVKPFASLNSTAFDSLVAEIISLVKRSKA